MTSNLLEAARRYLVAGFSLIPCRYKKPSLAAWQEYSVKRPSLFEVNRWFEETEMNQSIGLVLGQVSHNVVVVDLDGMAAARMFKAMYPHYLNTRIVMSGSLTGFHLYYRVETIPANLNVRVPDVGGFEIRGNGQYVIAPPSPHPAGHFYKVHRDEQIMKLENLNVISDWFSSLREKIQAGRQEEIRQAANPVNLKATAKKREYLRKVMSEEIARVYTAQTGNRNDSLFYAGLRLANYAAGGELQWDSCAAMLLTAALNTQMPESEARRTIESAWRIGSKRPKKVK
jgi:hypothetical protein